MSSKLRLGLLGALGLALSATAWPAWGDVIDARSTTILAGRQDARDGVLHTAVPLFEIVQLNASDIRNPYVKDLGVVVSGWGQVQFADIERGHRALGDVDVAFVEGKLANQRVLVRLGRQFLMQGAPRFLQMDGLNVSARLWKGLGVSAQAGAPVTPRFGVDRGDAMASGRVFYRLGYDAEAGVSIVHITDDGRIARQDLAADARVVPIRPLALGGFARWSIVEERLAEGDISLTWQLHSKLEITGDYRRTAPDLFLPRNSIFAVFSQETLDEGGGWLFFRPVRRLRLQGDYHAIRNEGDDGVGYRASAKAIWALGRGEQSTIGVEGRRFDLGRRPDALAGATTPQGGYLMARLFGMARFTPRVLATADLNSFWFDNEVNGQTRSFTGALTAVYDFKPQWRAVVTGIGSVTPYMERRFEGMVKLVYNFSAHIREVRP